MTPLLDARLRALTADSPVALRVVYADGSGFAVGAGSSEICVRFKTVGAQWRCLVLGAVGLLEAWFDGNVEIDGPLAPLFALGFEAGFDSPTLAVRVLNRWHEMRHNNASPARAKRNARVHYGLGDAFYKLWLDRDLLMYTCAYWKEGTRSLEEAQRAKVDHVCRKLMLAPGDRVVDIGCGFGGFMLHAAEYYGVSVEGVNTTTEQVAWLDAEIDRRQLRSTLSVREADFRDVARQYDKVVSIGVLEHAGRDQIDAVVKAHADSLAPGGLGLLHFIGHVGQYETEHFIRKHVFPGGWIPSLTETLDAMDRCGLEIIDIENLRRHYVLTLEAWTERFEVCWPQIQALDAKRFDERFRRIWRAYLTGCAEMFRASNGITGLFQITFGKGRRSPATYPMSRAFLYQEPPIRETQPELRHVA